jgi:hypothetical protein
MTRNIWGGWVWLGVAAVGCGSQASEDFSGESLLTLRGNVSVDPLASGPDSVPALCFHKQVVTSKSPVHGLPDDVREFFESNLHSGLITEAHIVDVEARGSFPAEFDVDVYTPPPSEALDRLIPDEPLSGFGWVCAVAANHKPTAQPLQTISGYTCATDRHPQEPGSTVFDGDPVPCSGQGLRVTQDGSRYFHKTWDCENGGDLNTCDITTDGDAELLRETGGYEGVYGSSFEVQVVYSSAPVVAGSYTAYRAYAPEGLPAGYHLRPTNAKFKSDELMQQCFDSNWPDLALAETNKLHGTDYDGLPNYYGESGEPKLAPANVIADYKRFSARFEMEACPLENMIIPDEPEGSLSIDLMPEWNAWDLLNSPWAQLPVRESADEN